MVTMIAVREAIRSLNDLRTKSNLKQTEDDRFFTEWYEDLPPITEAEKKALDLIKQRYDYHRAASPLLEGTINLVVISPLLEVAGFLDPPFQVRSPESIELVIEDPDQTIIRGLIDVLVVRSGFWVLVVESKRTSIPVTAALPQILAYMLANSEREQPTYGVATNGDSFIFIKLSRSERSQYDISDAFLLLPRHNRFYEVLQILKRLSQIKPQFDNQNP